MARQAVVLLVTMIGMVLFAAPAVGAPIPLTLPQGDAFSLLGHSCGGIQEKSYATGFDPATGYPIGDVYLSTSCGGSGRGGGYHSTTYTAWASVTWDFTSAVVTYSSTTSAAVDPTFSTVDQHGNELYNQSNSAYLLLADGFVPPPRLTGISVSEGPASGGTTVTIYGTGFTGATGVSFGGSPAASFTVSGDTSISATSPSAPAGTVDVTVTSAGGTSTTGNSDQFRFVGAPTVTGIDPAQGTIDGGTAVTITGTNLADATGVSFGEQATYFFVNADGTLTAYSPAAESVDTVSVTVASIGGTSAHTMADQFTYTDQVTTTTTTTTTTQPPPPPPTTTTTTVIPPSSSATTTSRPTTTTTTTPRTPARPSGKRRSRHHRKRHHHHGSVKTRRR